MAEIADWSPVDESNNSAPPVGAPENMAPSAVNNTMRAMMGAVRRWYDTVTTQLAGYLPLTGGTVTGGVAFNGVEGITIQGISLTNLLGALRVSNASGGGVSVDGPNAAYVFADRDGVSAPWIWYANSGTTHLLRADGSDIVTVSWAGQVTIAGNLTADYILSDGNIDATATLGAASIVSHGDITAAGQVNAAAFAASGNITAAGIATVGNVSASGTVATDVLTANDLTVADDVSIASDLAVGGNSTLTNVHVVGGINAIGNDSNFYIRKTGGEYVINFEPNSYLMFNSATNTFSIVIDGATKAAW